MPWKEAISWLCITVFGAGVYFLFDWWGQKRVWAAVIGTAISLVALSCLIIPSYLAKPDQIKIDHALMTPPPPPAFAMQKTPKTKITPEITQNSSGANSSNSNIGKIEQRAQGNQVQVQQGNNNINGSPTTNCTATILHNEGTIFSNNLNNNQIVCTEGQPNTKTLIHIEGTDAAKSTEQAKPQAKSEYVAIYVGDMQIGPNGVVVQDTIQASNPWDLLYKMLEMPKFAHDVETPIGNFEGHMKMFVSKSPATCRTEMDAAEEKIRMSVGHESEAIAILEATPSTCARP